MSRILIIREDRGVGSKCEPHCIHLVTIPSKGGYVQLVSHTAWRRRQDDLFMDEFHGRKTPRGVEFEHRWFSFEKWEEFYPEEADLPRLEHSDVWAFYAAIGWDYKAKRYI